MQGLVAINRQCAEIKEFLLRMEALATGLLPSNPNPFPKTAEVQPASRGAEYSTYGATEGVTPIAPASAHNVSVPKFGSGSAGPQSLWH